jgi:hypothetical protein
MSTFHLSLVSPEKLLFAGQVDQVDLPGVEGDFGVQIDLTSVNQNTPITLPKSPLPLTAASC